MAGVGLYTRGGFAQKVLFSGDFLCKMPFSLTERQDEALEAIRYHIKRYGMPPSRSELGKMLKIGNQAGVDRILRGIIYVSGEGVMAQ